MLEKRLQDFVRAFLDNLSLFLRMSGFVPAFVVFVLGGAPIVRR